MDKVRHVLARAGQISLIQNPSFVSIHADNPETPGLQLPSTELSADKKIIIKEFLTYLKESVSLLPEHQSRILRLLYNNNMSTCDILGFSQKIGLSLASGKEAHELKEQDIGGNGGGDTMKRVSFS